MTGRRGLLLAGVLATALAACGDTTGEQTGGSEPARREKVSRDAQAALIFGFLKDQGCKPGVLRAGDIHDHSAESTAAGKALDSWRERTLIAHPEQYPLLNTERSGRGWTGVGHRSTTETFGHSEDGRDMQVKILRTWGKAPRAINQRVDPEYMQVDVQLCASIPSHVEVLSTTGSAEGNWLGIAYQLHWKPTGIVEAALQSGAPFIAIDPPPAPQPGRAVLSRAARDQPWQLQID